MKKLMIAAAIVCAAAFAQAATVDWASGKLFTAADKDGGFSTTAIAAAANAELFTLTKAQYDTFAEAYATSENHDMSAVWDAYQKGEGAFASATLSGKTSSRSSIATLSEDPATAGMHYAAVIYTYTDATYGDMYIANIASINVESADMGGSVGNLGTHFLGDAAGTATGGWVAASSPVPEPTSGLLLLLGMAGLALRRRRA